MDILGSIMKKMVPPPALDEKQRKIRQQQKEAVKKQQEEQEKFVKKFREEIEKKLEEFASKSDEDRLVFEPMDKLRRAILHDLSETANLTAHSFCKDPDRYVIVFKTIPSDAELSALRRGETFDASQTASVDDDEVLNEDEGQPKASKVRKEGQSKAYLEKYEKHLGGLGVAKEAAKSTKTERAYGFVTSEQKRDRRTIEETLADIRDRKRKRTDADVEKEHD